VKKLKFAQIQEKLDDADFRGYPKLNVAVLRNIMVESIEVYLRYFAYKSGLNCQVTFGEYDNIFQEAVGGQPSLLNRDTDCVLVFMILDLLSWDLSRNFANLSNVQIQDEIKRIRGHIDIVIRGIRRQTDAMILWHALEIPLNPSLGIWDSQADDGQIASIRIMNEFLREELYETPNAYFVDTNLCIARIGAERFYDHRYWHIGRAPYKREALCEIAGEDIKFIRSFKGKNKKCLVLDCDNTLWGGTIGEDGIAGIKLGKTHPGSAFYEFQQEIVNLYHRGIIIALCSKNNEEDVWQVFREHPDIVLKEDHIAAAQINWRDKVTNLRQIALDLNIGLGGMVFVDDSQFEVNLVLTELPEVKAIHLPKNETTKYRHLLASSGLFDAITITDEDKNRGPMYKAEANRKMLKAQVTDMESYYCSLEMVADIRFADEFSVPRIAQQTQKTNQFNLTTKRYTEADIERMMEEDASDVIYIKLADRFGDSGIVGTCILRYEGIKAIFDTFLLSCRVIGRGVENVFIAQALKLAENRGCTLAIGEYCATRKNKQVECFYSQHDFEEMDKEKNTLDRSFSFDLNKKIVQQPEYFKEIKSQIGG